MSQHNNFLNTILIINIVCKLIIINNNQAIGLLHTMFQQPFKGKTKDPGFLCLQIIKVILIIRRFMK